MKDIVLLMSIFLGSGCVMAEPRLKATFHVTDAETSEVLTNAMVTVYNNGWESKKVEANGYCTFDGKGMSFGWRGRVELDGYYDSKPRAEYKKINHVLNRWEPWNPTVEVKLRKVRNPVSMIHRPIQRKAFKVPVYNQPIGYDLEKDAFVKPHGKGSRSDLSLEFTRDFENSQNYTVSCQMSFPSENDGIQEIFFPKNQFVFQWPYLAPTNNYKPKLVWESIRSKAKPVVHNFDEKNVNYIYRVRTQTDGDGNIISACYGMIEGPFGLGWADWVNWVYYFNPVPNERSLEWNGVNLLKKK